MNWTLLHKTDLYTEAAIVKAMLEENNIPAQILNKQDSMYVMTLPGLHEVYVPAHLKEVAMTVLKKVPEN